METLPCDFREGMETLPCEIRQAMEVLNKDKADRIQEIAEKQAIEMIQWYYDKLKEKEPDSYEDSSSSDDEDSCESDEDRCRRDWNRLYAAAIPAMRYTDKPAPPNFAWEDDTLQIFSIEVMGIEQQKLEWPLGVFGMVAARDSLDHDRWITITTLSSVVNGTIVRPSVRRVPI
ncbi:uncharacterized protein [Triticum aestivum]|uniref:uncharacterized protein isoform X2 n=1 Tax=Triticum aestivum TaxID=4565 RepID=UPI001D02F57F|nr:uncharacterized protein LOC123103920 isoform X2 [Triticum aestivum]